MARQPIKDRVRRKVIERDEGRCQWCGRVVFYLDGILWVRFAEYSLQHRRARGAGGTSREDASMAGNLVLVCGSATTGCHGYIESHRKEAQARGFTLFQNDVPIERTYTDWLGRHWKVDNDRTRDQVELAA